MSYPSRPEWADALVRRIDTYMQMDHWWRDEAQFSTRRYGDVGAQEPGKKDFEEARAVAEDIRERGIEVETEVTSMDEWVILKVIKGTDDD